MYDDLSRIESVYGSVAEYYRSLNEEEPYEPTEEEILKNEVDLAAYNKKLEILSGNPSEYVKGLVDTNELHGEKKGVELTTPELFDAILTYHGQEKYEEGNFYKPEKDKFNISVEYTGWLPGKDGNVHYKVVTGLPYDVFKKVFTDLYHARLYPTVCYMGKKEPVILSNCSLGNLRSYDFLLAGIESEESINADLEDAGFNEKAFKEAYIKDKKQKIMTK